jgi:hypothetical protein
MSTRSADGLTAGPTTNRSRIRLVVVLAAGHVGRTVLPGRRRAGVPAPWVLLQAEDSNAAEHRWFLTVAGTVDAIAVVMFIGLIQRPPPHAAVRRDVSGSRDRRRHHPAVRSVVRCHPCRGRRAACRLPVLAGRAGISILVGGRAAAPTDPRRARRSCAAGDGRRRPAPGNRGNGPGGSGELVVGLRGARHHPGRRRCARRQPGTRLAHPQVHLRCGSTLGLSPRWSSRTTPDRGDTSAVSPQSLSVSVSHLPRGKGRSTENLDLYDRKPRAEGHAAPGLSCLLESVETGAVDQA